jgi:tetratricopeptide (TPR) repeat protein
VKVWDAHTGRETLSLKRHTHFASSVAFSPDGKRIATGSADDTVKVWDAQTGHQLLSLKGHTDIVLSVAFSPDGKRIASGSRDRTVKVWDAHTGQQQLSLKGHTSFVTSVCFSPDGKRLASGSAAQTVKVWDAHTGQQLLSLKGHTSPVTSVAFSPDGKRLFSEDWGGRRILWGLAPGRQLPGASGQGISGGPRSPDGRRFALIEGNVIRVYRLVLTAEELAEARRWVEPDFGWHAAEARSSEAAGQWFAAAFHLDRLLPSRPWDADLHTRRAYALARLGRPQAAAIHDLHALLLNPSVRCWPLAPEAATRADKAARAGDWSSAAQDYRLAAHQPGAATAIWANLLLALRSARQEELYRQSCTELLDLFRSVRDDKQADAVAWCLRLGPCGEADANRAVRIAERLIKLKRDSLHLETLGVTLYRAGRFAEAVKALEEGIKLQGKGGGTYTWIFLAMTHKQLGHHDEARKWFDKFEGWYDKQQIEEWRSKAEWKLLHQEAKDLANTMPHVAPGD